MRAGEDAGHLWGAGLSLSFYGYRIALVFAAPLGWVLAWLLRPIRQQRIHIAAFLVVPNLAFWAVAGLVGFGWDPRVAGTMGDRQRPRRSGAGPSVKTRSYSRQKTCVHEAL
ncbi:hypothetical protein [Pseudarthrobacter polychromogenes]|uniref:Uncharacterized protein n=1 Tax=Pseudarthrobacter polychromogenes TaxID=1676 RepID=A0ABQ1XK71_9MICC|nr:hypothetical protein [Arthrobacter sp. S1_S22]GGG95877.1 hypothetical protein GCM10011577_18710 [Pseudarthrobacter polychromogenes]